MSNHSAQAIPRSHRGFAGQFGRQFVLSMLAGEWLHTWETWMDRSHQRRQLGELAELNDYLLKDIGVSREEALREAAKPFWR